MDGLRVLSLIFTAMCSAQPPSLLLPADKCWLSPQFRKTCGFAGISGSECVRRGCCFDIGSADAPECFYSLDSLPVCTEDGRVLVAISKDLTLPPLNLSSVHVKDGSGAECHATSVSADTVLFQFRLTECGTTQRMDGGNVVYETDVLGRFEVLDGALGSVTRDSPFMVHVQCRYNGSQESKLHVTPHVYTVSPPLPAIDTGALLLELRIARDGAYRSWYVAADYPIMRVLRYPVFVEVRVLNVNDPSLVLVLNECWATPGTDMFLGLRWDLLVDRCPFAGDNYKTRLFPVAAASHLRFPTHHQRFVVSTFAFVDLTSSRALRGEVYFHCRAEVCSPSVRDTCTAPCQPTDRANVLNETIFQFAPSFSGVEDAVNDPAERRRSAEDRAGTLVTAAGPIILLEDEERLSAGFHQQEEDAAGDSPSLVLPGVAVGAALLSVALLVGAVALWKRDAGVGAGSDGCSVEL